MSTAPVGAYVRIYYDGAKLSQFDCLMTPTGRTYEVVAVRVQARGKHVGRQHLLCKVVARPWYTGRVLPLRWYPRGRAAVARARRRGTSAAPRAPSASQ